LRKASRYPEDTVNKSGCVRFVVGVVAFPSPALIEGWRCAEQVRARYGVVAGARRSRWRKSRTDGVHSVTQCTDNFENEYTSLLETCCVSI
jgi:hypothetical protein